MGILKRIHVNQSVIRKNLKSKINEPPIIVRTSKGTTYCYEAECQGKTKIVYRPEKPLSCGARLWIETTGDVIICDTDEVI